MKKTTLLILLLAVTGLTAQSNRFFTKEMERARLNHVRPVEHHYDHMRNANTTSYLNESFDSGIPATWNVVDNTGNGAWQGVTDYNSNTLDGTPFAIIDSDSAGSVALDTELTSPAVDVSAAAAVILSFDHYLKIYSGNEIADVDVYDGTQWVNVYTSSSTVGAWGAPDHQSIDVTAYKNANFQVRFHYYNANYDWYWAVDNISIIEPDADDLAVTDVFPGTYQSGENFVVKSTVYNNGSNTQSNFDVQIQISDATNTVVYNETVNVTGASVALGDSYDAVATTPANLPAGTYTLQATVVLTGDANAANDSFSAPLNIVDYASTYTDDKVYSYDAFDADSSGDQDHLTTIDIPSATVNDVAALTTNDFLTAGTFVNNKLVGIEYGTNTVYFIDGSGNAYKYGNIKGLSGSASGIAATSAGVYISTPTELYVINNPLLEAQLVGAMNNGGGVMIGIAADNNDNLYGIDLGDDNFYSIDKTTGGATVVGAIGQDLRYAQDLGADPTTGNIYGTLYVVSGNNGSGGLYSFDKTTGAATLMGSATQDEYTVCAIHGTTLSISDNQIQGLKVYPNPTNNVVLLKANENILKISLINIAGQTIFSQENNGMNSQIDLSNLPAGNYILKITTDKTIGTKQIIKR